MIGVVCAGAGARGAYEAGALSVLLPWLVSTHPEEPVVLVGTSAGAINAALFAGVLDAGRPAEEAVEEALDLWRTARPSEVFRPLWSTAPGLALRYGLEVAGLPVHVDSLLDSSPLRRTMRDKVSWPRLDENLAGGGRIHAAAVAATDCGTSQTTVFVQGRVGLPPPDPLRGIDYRSVALRPAHVQASAAIPVAFRPVRVPGDGTDGWYVDGGVRLNAPIVPALDLGADKVAVVATTPDPDLPGSPAPADGEPDVFDAGAVTLRAVLVDRMAEDVRHLRQVNDLVAAAGGGPVRSARRTRAYASVPDLYIGPRHPDAIAQRAREVFHRFYRGPAARLSDLGALATLLGGVGGVHGELFSFLFFDGRFHAELIDMGRADAREVVARGWS